MIKKWITAAAFCAAAINAAAQYKDNEEEVPTQPGWSASAGSMIYFFRQSQAGVTFNGINTLLVAGIRYNFKYLGKTTAISVGSYPGAGAAFFNGFGTSNVFFSLDLPLLLELHTGLDAHPYVQNRPLGFFAGAGMGINLLSKQFYLNNPRNGFSYGPTVNTGLKFNFNGRPLIIRASYLLNFNPDLPDLKAIGALWSLGGR
jgi:hypothetical protein